MKSFGPLGKSCNNCRYTPPDPIKISCAGCSRLSNWMPTKNCRNCAYSHLNNNKNVFCGSYRISIGVAPTPCREAREWRAIDTVTQDRMNAVPEHAKIAMRDLPISTKPPFKNAEPLQGPLSFWMVFREDSTHISKRHLNYGDAEAEATRLAKKSVGKKFYVLKAQDCIEVKRIMPVMSKRRLL